MTARLSLWCFVWVALLSTMLLTVLADSAGTPTKIGGTFRELLPPQQALVQRWAKEYASIFTRPISPAEFYDHLPLSTRTTFVAVTHALLHTTLSSEQGKPMGTAIELIDMVERVAGQIPGTRGDRQFRAYVYLKAGAINKLYAAREFRRTRDNTVYHVGYPINFRQQGGTPSIQFSVTRTGRRADIDVDYRSSSGIVALTNGHLTAANSDVRAGQNELVHNRRWNGLSDWWRDIIAVFIDPSRSEESIEGFTPGAETERRRIARGPIQNAIHAYLTDWLIERKPKELLPLVSVKAYPCVAEFGGDVTPDTRLALARILREMERVAAPRGAATQLDDLVRPFPYPLPDAHPVKHDFGELFSLQEVHEDVAWAIDCRNRYRMQMAEAIPRPPHRMARTYVASMRIGPKDGAGSFYVQTWQQEAGEWRLVSFDIKRKTMSPPPNLLTASPSLPAATSAEARLAEDAAKLLNTWLIRKRSDEASGFFLPAARSCDVGEQMMHGDTLTTFLTDVARSALPNQQNGRLEGVVLAPSAAHHEMKFIAHSHSSAFLLAEVSGSLAQAASCEAPSKPVARSAARSSARAEKVMATLFELVQAQEEASAVLTLYWKNSPEGWQVASFHIDVD